MSTRSAIGIMHGDVIKAIYCHFDGYIGYNGAILHQFYDSPKTNHLIAMGNVSILGAAIGEKHNFDDPKPKSQTLCLDFYPNAECTFYGRDRGDQDEEFGHYFSDAELFDAFDVDYYYLMKNGVWYVTDNQHKSWSLLSDKVAEVAKALAHSLLSAA